MKTRFFLFAAMFAVFACWNCDDDDDPDPEPYFPSKLELRQFDSQALANNPAGTPTLRNVNVYTPEHYNPDGDDEYPVVYLLHGLPFGEDAYISQEAWDHWVDPEGMFKTYPDFPQEGFQKWVDNMIAAGEIDPLIIVMPDAESLPYGFCFYTNSALNGNFEDFIANDLVAYIDANYKTMANSHGRAVIGHSQGGYGAIKLGMKHPDKFGTVAAHSAPLYFEGFKAQTPLIIAENPDGMMGPDPAKFLTSSIYAFAAAWSPNLNNPPFMVDLPFEHPSGATIEETWARWLEHDPLTMLGTYGANFKSLDGIYFDAGLNDVFGFNLTADAFHQALDANGIAHTYENFDGDHFDKAFARLEVSLGFCSGKMHE